MLHSAISLIQKNVGENAEQNLAIDLGSATTRILAKQKIIFEEPMCIAVHRQMGSVIAIGEAATELWGKTPPTIEVVFPIRRGKVVEPYLLRLFLESVLLKKLTMRQLIWFPLRWRKVTLSISSASSSMQKNFLEKVFHELGFSSVKFVNKNAALLAELKHEHVMGNAACMVEVGGMTTEVSIVAQGEVVTEKCLQIGGDDFTQEIIRIVRKVHQCEIGWQTAEKTKKNIGRICTVQSVAISQPKLLVIRGRDAVNSLPKTIQISSSDFEESFQHLAHDIFLGIRQLCQDAPAELVTAALDEGIFLTGGGSMLNGLAEYLTKEFHCPVHQVSTPSLTVAKGL